MVKTNYGKKTVVKCFSTWKCFLQPLRAKWPWRWRLHSVELHRVCTSSVALSAVAVEHGYLTNSFICTPNHLLLQHRRNRSSHLRPSVPEIKLLVLFSYYFLLVAIALPGTSFSTSNAAKFNSTLYEYFDCESAGFPNNCSRSVYTEYTNPTLRVVGNVLFSLIPAVHLIYVIHWKKAKLMLLCSLDNLTRNLRLQKDSKTQMAAMV